MFNFGLAFKKVWFLFVSVIVLFFGVSPVTFAGDIKEANIRKQGNDIHFDVGNTYADIFLNVTGERAFNFRGAYLNLTDSTVTLSRSGLPKTNVVVYDTTTTARSVALSENGAVFVTSSASHDDPVTFKLPPASPGLTYTFTDVNTTAAAFLWVTAASGDVINGGTAGKSYKNTSTAVKQTLTLVAVDSTNWVVVYEVGTWANDNS